ncbi:hypothetical protein [Lacipirellula limnantheis]|uniref:Uncharacterized protein n=1 Tax=Lacipirellula limnantheis TaxID=2528024 RepID=A0A517TVT0_9BACT|nr:hypothetical protein [Lacipirellula limnantheis]QDT72476.1 hypothetical protein I41_16550 [Lacipirellula limnantheis]
MRQGVVDFRPAPNWTSAGGICLLFALVFCTSGASCTRTMRSPFAAWQPPAPQVLMTGSSLDQVIAAVNANAARIQSIQTNNASITVPGMPGIPLLGGKIAAQRPGRFHLVAGTALTGDEVDMGSNDQQFWFWVKRNEPPALFYSRHDQFAGSAAQRMMPIEPQWLLDAIGFAEFRPGDAHTGPRALGSGRVEIQSMMQTRTGRLTKRTVVDATRALVLEQHVYDQQGTLVASAVAKTHKYYDKLNINLPDDVEIRIPASELSLSIAMGTVEINTLGENPQLWTMPSKPGVPLVDLGASQANAATPRMGDQITDANWYGPGPAVGQIQTGASPVSVPISPPVTAYPTPSQTAAAPQRITPAPQFIHPSGVELPAASVARQNPYPGVQQLPAGGVTGSASLTR